MYIYMSSLVPEEGRAVPRDYVKLGRELQSLAPPTILILFGVPIRKRVYIQFLVYTGFSLRGVWGVFFLLPICDVDIGSKCRIT